MYECIIRQQNVTRVSILQLGGKSGLNIFPCPHSAAGRAQFDIVPTRSEDPMEDQTA